ncbi:MAG: hypothetical protein WKG32_03875 [Gemmatimonadaceae bacterium]
MRRWYGAAYSKAQACDPLEVGRVARYEHRAQLARGVGDEDDPYVKLPTEYVIVRMRRR